MWLIILISLLSLIFLLVLHEAGHFLVAKYFNMEVKEFGIGYPPRLFSKKIKGTIYSLNLIPFGAFVDIPRSAMRAKSFWKRFWVLSAGIISFWVFAFLLFAFSLFAGAPTQITDDIVAPDAYVQIISIEPFSPADKAGLEAGDIVSSLNGEQINKTREVQDFMASHKGEKVSISVVRGKEKIVIEAVPRVSPPKGQGRLGVMLARVALQKWSFGEALKEAGREVFALTFLILQAIGKAIISPFTGEKSGLKLAGPIGIMKIFIEKGSLGVSYFFQTMGLISLNLAIINALPFLPVADGGRVFFLLLEKIRKKSLNEKTEEKINSFFFIFLLLVMVLVTINDIMSFL